MDKDGNRHCRKPNHAIVNPNPNTNNFVALPNCYSEGCKDLLAKLGFMHKHRLSLDVYLMVKKLSQMHISYRFLLFL